MLQVTKNFDFLLAKEPTVNLNFLKCFFFSALMQNKIFATFKFPILIACNFFKQSSILFN